VKDETGSGGQDRVEKIGNTGQGRHAAEAAVGEGRAVEPFGRCLPAELAVEPVVVVVAGVGGDGRLGRGEIGELLAIEDLRLEDRPEASILPLVQGVSIWVRMWRIASSARLRWNRLRIVLVVATNGVPLSVMSS
jgi:hypothetical protein